MGIVERLKLISQKLSTVWLVGVFVIFVYYMDDKYFNMLEAKSAIVQMGALFFVGISSILTLMICNYINVNEAVKAYLKSCNCLDGFVLAFGASAILSNLVTNYKSQALTGSYGWSVGTTYIVLICLAYFFVSRWVVLERKAMWGIGVLSALQFAIVLAHGFYIDVLSMHKQLAAKDYVRYVGTVGNTNWYVGYVVMLLPFFLMGIHFCKKKIDRIGCRVLLILATMTFVTINCQGIYLGVGAVGVAYFFWSMSTYGHLRKALENVILMLISFLLLVILGKIKTMVPVDGINVFVLNPSLLGVGLISCLFLYFLLGIVKEEKYNDIKSIIKILFLVIVLLCAGIILYSQVIGFNDSWGTNRGRIWRVAVKAFVGMPGLQKLFGGGTNCFGYFYQQITGSEWVRNAHNEFLEYLVTMGLFGELSYLGIYAFALKRRKDLNPVALGCKLAVLGYMAQGIVNNPWALNGVIFFTILALYRRNM